MSGQVEASTNDDRLWLSTTDSGVTLQSGFRWAQIGDVVHESKHYTAGEFKLIVNQLVRSQPTDATAAPPLPMEQVIAATRSPARVIPVAFTHPEPPAIRSLRVRAWAASWDADPELDGLLVEVTPLSADGEFVAVEGQLSLTLIGENSQGHPEQLRRFRPQYPEITRSTEQVYESDFFAGPAVYKLPYRNIVPETRLDLFPQGVLTATLGVPGQGSFSASTDAVSLIPASPIRDRRQQLLGTRYFPQERSRVGLR